MPLGCTPALLIAPGRRDTDRPGVDSCSGDLLYAQLRLEMTRLARRVVGPQRAAEVVQQVFRHVARTGATAPRDPRGVPRPAYLAALVHAFAGEDAPGTERAALDRLDEALVPGGARGG